MKIIIYIGGFELPDKNAAAQRVVANAKMLRELGYTVVFVDIDRDNAKAIKNTKSLCFGFTRYSMRYTVKRLISISDFKSIFKEYQNELCGVIAYNYPGIALNKMRIFCKRHGVKIYADCTEWYQEFGGNLARRLIKKTDTFIRMNIVQPKLDGIIAISQYLTEYYKTKLPTVCIPPLTDVDDPKWIKEQRNQSDGIEIVYAGSPGRHKDKLNKLIESLAALRPTGIHFSVIGLTREQFVEYYPEDSVLLNSLGQSVSFLGRLPHTEVLQYLKQADFSIFYRDVTRVTMAGFPTKFSESITCGTPVITNKTSDLEEYLVDGVNGFWIDDLNQNESDKNALSRIFSLNIPTLRGMKSMVDSRTFDYRAYTDKLAKLLNI